jgi:ribonuclease HI
MDYASTVWHNPAKNKWQITALNTVQRPAMIKIISAFRTTATQALEAETFLLLTHLRLAQRAKDVLTKLLTLPRAHPIMQTLNRAIKSRLYPKHEARTPIQRAVKTLNEDQLEAMESIDTCPSPPWQEPPFARICAEMDLRTVREEVSKVMRDPTTVIYTDASAKEGNLGAAVIMLDTNDTISRARQITVGPDWKWDVPNAELIAIYYAVDLAIQEQQTSRNPESRTYTIFTDSRTGLQALANSLGKPGSQIIQEINNIARIAKDSHHIHLNLRWIPSHSGIRGNEEADWIAKMSVGQVPNHRFSRLASLQRKATRVDTQRNWSTEWNRSTKGQYLQRIDTSIPGPHVRKLYDHLPQQRASLLAQLRTGHNWLKSFRKRVKHSDSNRCEYGAVETLVHVFIDCPNLREPRRQLRKAIGDRFNDLTIMLGGRTQRGSKITAKELNAVLDFAEQSGRFRNRDQEPDNPNSG